MLKPKVDEFLLDSKSNFRIRTKLEESGFPSGIIPTGKQLSNRRFYLMKLMLKELANNTEGGYYSWLKQNQVDFKKAGPHDLLLIDSQLTEKDFILVFSSKSFLQNASKESKEAVGFCAIDSTHKLVNCSFKLTTIMTSSINHELADVCYALHAHEDTPTFTPLNAKKKF